MSKTNKKPKKVRERQTPEKVDEATWNSWKLKRTPGTPKAILEYSDENKLGLHGHNISTALNHGLANQRTKDGIAAYFASLDN